MLPAALGVGDEWVGDEWMGEEWLRVPPTHVYMHVHAHTCMHIYTLNMIISIANGSPHWGNTWEFPMMSYACACACMIMCVGGTLSPLLTLIHPPPPPRGTPRISQNSIALELIEIFQFCLKILNLWRLPHSWVGEYLGGWVGG